MKQLGVRLSIFLFAVVLTFSLANCQEDENGVLNADIKADTSEDRDSGLLSFIFSPISSTFNQAKRFLGFSNNLRRSVSDLVVDGFDEIQVRAFRLFMRAYNKTYESPEEIRRRMVLFFERRKIIEQSARDFIEGRIPFMMRENTYSDWDESELKTLAMAVPPKTPAEMTKEEREVILDGEQGVVVVPGMDELGTQSSEQVEPPESDLVVSATKPYDDLDENGIGGDDLIESEDHDDYDDSNLIVMAPERIPASKDWRTSGCVAAPIDQMKCGACYAIATVNTLESMRCIRQTESPILSPQQVVDCSTPRAGYKNYGCDGGWPTRVLNYLQNTRIIARDSCYPFVRRQESCKLPIARATEGCTLPASVSGTSLGYKVLNNERDILYHVAKTGPVITVMQARDSFVYYSRGIYDDPKCSRNRDDVDHAIAIVGYGRENGLDYWLIKNSWGTTDWGEGGFGKYLRGKNACSIGYWGWVITS